MAQAACWDDIAWLLQQTHTPVPVRGIVHPDDASMARDTGLDGVIVSNHGGRTLSTTLPTAHALSEIDHAQTGSLPILVDGCIRRGTDVPKALALGASAVSAWPQCMLESTIPPMALEVVPPLPSQRHGADDAHCRGRPRH